MTTNAITEDKYRWMESNEKPEVQEWLKQQSETTGKYLDGIPVRKELREQFQKLFSLDTVGTPAPRKGLYFVMKRRGDQDMSVLYVSEGISGIPRVLIDPNTLSEDKTVTIKQWRPSRDGKLLAYGLSNAGNDKFAIYVMDVVTGVKLSDEIPDDFYPSFLSWNTDGTGFWYRKHDPRMPMSEAKLYLRIYFHALGSKYQDDLLVFGEDLEKDDYPGMTISQDGRYMLVEVGGRDRRSGKWWNEIYLRDLALSDVKFVKVMARIPDITYDGRLHRDRLYVITNQDAPRMQILEMDLNDAVSGHVIPKVLIPEGKGVIDEVAFVGNKIFVATLQNVYSAIHEYNLHGDFVSEVVLPSIGSAGGFSCEKEGEELFFSFESFAIPRTIYRLDLVKNNLSIFAQMEAGFDVEMIETKQVWYPSKDGTQIPMFLVYKKGVVLDGNNPTVLYGYGGFNISLTPSFNKGIIPFVLHGGIYAIANIRGGGEFGKEWHEAGMQKNKQNVFDDFAEAAKWLISSKYTRKEKLAIEGGSNGGLLVTAIVIQNPGLVEAGIASVPVTDMLRYHLFFGGVHWIPDYGDPDNEEMRKYLLGYSPYHNVKDGEKYPAMLIVTSDNDDRVHPMHSYKMTARLQEANTSKYPILLRVELKAGHGGASAITKYVEEQADVWSFVFDQLKML
ncbi:MAG: prolyl oligopeptidase family serine peptidase [Candidatus Parcubacteria bacterium]|nr:prolyl oligopeptidase family serine peptidase [Candidatus Parcubacteria bacterium]